MEPSKKEKEHLVDKLVEKLGFKSLHWRVRLAIEGVLKDNNWDVNAAYEELKSLYN